MINTGAGYCEACVVYSFSAALSNKFLLTISFNVLGGAMQFMQSLFKN